MRHAQLRQIAGQSASDYLGFVDTSHPRVCERKGEVASDLTSQRGGGDGGGAWCMVHGTW